MKYEVGIVNVGIWQHGKAEVTWKLELEETAEIHQNRNKGSMQEKQIFFIELSPKL